MYYNLQQSYVWKTLICGNRIIVTEKETFFYVWKCLLKYIDLKEKYMMTLYSYNKPAGNDS